MIDTTGTRYELEEGGEGLWLFKGWRDFLASAGLTEFDHFVLLSGTEVDRNRRSLVYRLRLGEEKQLFYLKLHKNYVKKSLSTLFKKVVLTQIELMNMMHYARAGLDALEPVAWGWRSGEDGDISFLLIKNLDGYQSLQEFLNGPGCSSRRQRHAVARAVKSMLVKMHRYGLAHVDLFSWHVYVKKIGESDFRAHPIDLERTKVKGGWPWSQWLIRRKQANDLAVLHLTVPWPQISSAERMRFYHAYCKSLGSNVKDRSFLKLVLTTARHRGRKRKFKPFGVAEKIGAE